MIKINIYNLLLEMLYLFMLCDTLSKLILILFNQIIDYIKYKDVEKRVKVIFFNNDDNV